MKRSLLFILLALPLGAGVLSGQDVRQWTSADDASKQFEGTLIEAKGDQVTIKHANGKLTTFAQAKLSEEDRKFIADHTAAAAAAKERTEKAQTSPMARALKGRTLALDGKRLKKTDFLATKSPEYYLLYWGASWCGPCQQGAPSLVELYNEKLAKATNIELIHISSDQEEDGMLSFVTDHKMSFPVVSYKDRDRLSPVKSLFPSGIPSYKLVDATGTLIAEGQAAKDKAAEIAAGTSEVAAQTR